MNYGFAKQNLLKKRKARGQIFGLLILTVYAGLSSLLNGETKAISPTPRLNILFVIADDLNTRLGCYGDKKAHTPALDRLASESVMFTKAYAAGTVCTPSRKVILTGQAIHKVGADNSNYMKNNPTAMTLPRWFREHGYQTARIGKIEHGPEYAGPMDWEHSLQISEQHHKLKVYKDIHGKVLGQAQRASDEGQTNDQLRAQGFKDFIASTWDRNRPFLFALGFHSPHMPWQSQVRHRDLHPLDQMPLTKAPSKVTPMTKPPMYQKKMLAELQEPLPGEDRSKLGLDIPELYNTEVPETTQREMLQEYYAAVSMMDEVLDGVMKFLRDQKLDSSTLVVFTSDQGYFLGYRGIWMKHYLYPEVLNVPLLVKVPGMKHAGSKAEGIVELLDIFPTLTDLAQIPPAPGLDGLSFKPQLENPAHPGKPLAYAQGIMYGGRALISQDWWYLHWPEGPFVVRAAGGRVTGKSFAVLDDILDIHRLKKSLTIHLDGSQKWIDIQGHLEASRELYHVSKDSQAWFDVLQGTEDHEKILAQMEQYENDYFKVKKENHE